MPACAEPHKKSLSADVLPSLLPHEWMKALDIGCLKFIFAVLPADKRIDLPKLLIMPRQLFSGVDSCKTLHILPLESRHLFHIPMERCQQ